MFGRPSFGVSQPSTFGFGSTPSTPFGQNQLFGNTSSGSFGSSSSSTGFGSSTQPIFGATQQPGSTLFGSSSAPSFGQTNQSSFGSSPFGSSSQQTSGSGLFGTSGNTFGQQNKPSGFGFSSASTGGLFGQNAQQTQQGTSLFQPSSSGGLFGSSSTFGSTTSQAGTPIKFTLVTGTDSMQKAGVAHTISTKHHCITCMKEYENKSLEELRWEDYQCNRKGPQQQPGFGTTTPFGQTASTAPSLFGQTENKTVFGQTSTGFGQTPGFGLTSQNSAQNIFGKPTSGFGTTTTASAFGFGTNTSSTGGLFGSSNTTKPFGAPANQTLFGSNQTQQNTGFGTSNIFGQTNSQNAGGIFGKPSQPTGFNTGQSGFTFGAPQQNQTNLFQNTNKTNTGFSIFGQNSSSNTTFGQQPSTFGGFNTFNKPTQNTFGQPSQPTFGLGVQSGGSIFGNANVKPSGNLFGTSGTTNLFGNNNFQTNTGFTLPVQQQQSQPQNLSLTTESHGQEFRNIVQLTDPYGYSPHLEGLLPVKLPETTYVTNPKEIQKLLDVPQTINISSITKRMKVLPATSRKVNLFDDVMDKQTSDMNFTLRISAKRLVLKKGKSASALSSLHESFSSVNLPLSESFLIKGSSSSDLSNIPNKDNDNGGPSFIIPPLKLSGITENNGTNNFLSNESAARSNDLLDKTPISTVMNKSDEVHFTNQEITSPTYEIGDPPNVEKQNSSIDTCGVILTRPEYYTIPPLEKLIEHKQSDGSCLIKGFTIGRVGYGSVSFPDLMDIANFNLDDLVHFRYRELTIYPDDASKPPLGQGLNRAAQVTLDRVYPKSKTDRSLIANIDTLIAINFSDTLRDICERHGTKFLDYRPDTGSWVFMVDHFSKYGFTDSDDDEVNEKILELKEAQAKQLTEKKRMDENGVIKGIMEIENEEMDKTIEILEDDSLKDNIDKELDSQGEYIQHKGLGGLTEISDNIEDIDIDFPKSLSAIKIHHVETRRSLYKTRGNLIYLMKASLFDEESLPGDTYTDTEVLESEHLFKDFKQSHIQKKEKAVMDKPDIFSLFNKSCNIFIEKSLLNYRNYMDIAIFKGRSFKIGWGKGLVLTTTLTPAKGMQYINESTLENTSSTIAIMDVATIVNEEAFVDSLPEHLRVILETSDVNLTNGIPLFKVKIGKSALLRHQFLATEITQRNMSNEIIEYHKEIWDLCLAFWGPITKPETPRHQFSKWLENVTRKEVLSDLTKRSIHGSESLFTQFFIHLSGHQIQEAAELAMNNKMPRLSMLISQLNLNDSSKSTMQMQLKEWIASQYFKHVDTATQKIYMILSGIPINNTLYNTELGPNNVCKDLDWRRTLAMHLWYMTPSTFPLNIAINLYTEAFDKHSYVINPSSKYINNFKDAFDIQYHLMMLYCNNKRSLEVVLNPDTHTQYPYDYRLSWLLLQTLASLQVGIISTNAKYYITTSFSGHLENLGLHKWAVFVLLFIEDEILKKNLVMGVLDRNIQASSTSTEIEDEIVQEFFVPSSWIHEVKSNKTMLLTRYWEAFRHLAFTQKWYDCHNIGIMHVLPQLIINEDYNALKILLETLEQGHHLISNWKYQGGLLLDFLKLLAIFDEKNKLSRETVLATHSTLLELCSRLSMFPTCYSNQIACISEISKQCYLYIQLLLSYMGPTYYGIHAKSSAQMEQFIMPLDYKMEELLKGIGTFFQEA